MIDLHVVKVENAGVVSFEAVSGGLEFVEAGLLRNCFEGLPAGNLLVANKVGVITVGTRCAGDTDFRPCEKLLSLTPLNLSI